MFVESIREIVYNDLKDNARGSVWVLRFGYGCLREREREREREKENGHIIKPFFVEV